MNDLTIDNFKEKTGKRFRITSEQKIRIANGSLTREQAFQEFLKSGDLQKTLQKKSPKLDENFWTDPELSLENFSEKAEQATGHKHRYRVSIEQKTRIENGTLTREQAFEETVRNYKQNTVGV